MSEQLTPHFLISEISKSQIAFRHGIDNTPNQLIIDNARETAAHILEPVRAHFSEKLGHEAPISPSSWYRCPELNRIMGGATNSQHVTGEAVDFEIPGIRNDEIFMFIRDNLDFDQLIAEYLSQTDGTAGWIHVSFSSSINRHQTLSGVAKSSYHPGLVYV